jgi:glucose/arabinose dehydrogenase/cytochrome c2
LRVISQSKLDPEPVPGTPMSGINPATITDLTADPDFAQNHLVYLLVTEGSSDRRLAAVYRARYESRRLTDANRIFQTKDCSATLCSTRLLFLTDKTLLVGVAEPQHARAQQLDSHVGKILRINRNGFAPRDNPFIGVPNALSEIWSYGHRVSFGLYQDPETSVIWQIESGPRGGDELNRMKPGANYGWAKASWGFAYNNNGLEAPLQSARDIEDPLLVWTPSVTPSGLTKYRGTRYPSWTGDYFVGQLTTRGVERVRIRDGRVVLQERLLQELDERIRDIKQGADGYLYVLTDHPRGRLLRLQPGRPRSWQLDRIAHKLQERVDPKTTSTDSDTELAQVTQDDIRNGQQAFVQLCSSCHRAGDVPGGSVGPDLTRAYGRLAGRGDNFDYSTNMADSPILWNYFLLNKFLSSPQVLMPGTKMSSPPITDSKVRHTIIAFLKTQAEVP